MLVNNLFMNSLTHTISPEEQIVLKINEYQLKLGLGDTELADIRSCIPINGKEDQNNYLFSYLLKRWKNEAMAEAILEALNKKQEQIIKALNYDLIQKEQGVVASMDDSIDEVLSRFDDLPISKYDIDFLKNKMEKDTLVIKNEAYDDLLGSFSDIYTRIEELENIYQEKKDIIKKISLKKRNKIDNMLKFGRFSFFKKFKVNL